GNPAQSDFSCSVPLRCAGRSAALLVLFDRFERCSQSGEPLAETLASISATNRSGKIPHFKGAVGFASRRLEATQSNFRASSHPLRIHSWRELLLVPLHTLLSAQECESRAYSQPGRCERANRRDAAVSGTRRRIANHRRRRRRCLLARWSRR